MVIRMQQRVANFLGVVGTDIPIKELIRMTSPFKLGVNGYAFALTNNGHIIFHPDWRPVVGLGSYAFQVSLLGHMLKSDFVGIAVAR